MRRSFVCPRCGAESFNRNDIRERYCGRCHAFIDDQEALEALWRPDRDFIGPVGPPMALWLKDREAQAKWEVTVNLRQPPEEPPP